MNKKELLKDLAKIADKNGLKRILVITDKGVLFEKSNMETVNDLMLAVNFVMNNIVAEGKLNVNDIPAIIAQYGMIIKDNIKNSMKSC